MIVFTPARMSQINCIIEKNYRKPVACALQKSGLVEVEFLSNEFLEQELIRRSSPEEEVDAVSRKIILANKLIDYFSEFDESEVNFLEDVLGVEKIEPRIIDRFGQDELLGESGDFLSSIDGKVSALNGKIAENQSKYEQLSVLVETLNYFSGLDFKVEWLGESQYLYTNAAIARESDFISLQNELSMSFGDGFGVESAGCGDGRISFLVYTLKHNAVSLDGILRKNNCEVRSFAGKGSVSKLKGKVEGELEYVKDVKAELGKNRGVLFNRFYGKLLEVHELLDIEKNRCEVFIRCGQTENTVFMRLWTTQKDKGKVLDIIDEKTEGFNLIEVVDDVDDAPILLDNPPVIRSFETLTKLFSPPRYSDIDPTPLIAPTFALFFGLMLTDAVYGLMLALGSYYLIRKYGKYSKGLYDLCVILVVCGIAAILFGFLTGSFLGDLVGKYILGGEGSQDVALWLDPLYKTNSIIFLTVVCIAGFIHLFIGYFIGIYDSVRKGKIKEALIDYGSWFILAGGVALIILVKTGKLPETVNPIGYALTLTGLILLFMSSGLMAFLKIVGVVGNTLSYARLLALALTTAGIAMTFNFLADISKDIPYIGLGVAAIVFILGHTINIFMNTLGGFVHALRLHYVEFFGTFYPGGGREFTPFREERKYTR